MKRVRGTPWDKVIHQKQLDENLSILLRVADAVAFAHAGGVIHRDLKPENVMLGDYGEVLVMDWGLARITPEFAHVDAVYQADSLGGTPAYMSPEMAKGPVESDQQDERRLPARRDPVRDHRRPAAPLGPRRDAVPDGRVAESHRPDPLRRRAEGNRPQGDGHAAGGSLPDRQGIPGSGSRLPIALGKPGAHGAREPEPAEGPRRRTIIRCSPARCTASRNR